jgi:DNA-binding transcriptional LysR family regulator
MKRAVAAAETPAPDLQDLRAFCRVVDLRSITAAARSLGETKGTVSRRISRLESALGVLLLQRSPRSVAPTEEGTAYRARVGRALELLEDAHAEVQDGQRAPRGHLRVTAPPDLAVTMVSPIVAGFIDRVPDVTVELVVTEARLDFESHQLDMAIRATGSLQDSSLVAHKLEDIDGRLFASPHYLAAKGTPRQPDDLARHRYVHSSSSSQGQATLELRHRTDGRTHSQPLRAAVSSTNMLVAKASAIAGAGVVLLPVGIARADVSEGRLQPVLKDWSGLNASLYLVHRATRSLPPKARAFRDYVLETLGVAARR